MTSKLETKIIEYFNFINPHEYDDLKFRFSRHNKIVFMTVCCDGAEKACKFFGSKGRDLNILKQLELEMSDIFPFDFYINCEFKLN
jgi:hypothetical protein